MSNFGDGGVQWYYLDSTGQEFGPFPTETMFEWYERGYFPIGEELLVRLPIWDRFMTLGELYKSPRRPFVGPPRTPRISDRVEAPRRSGRNSMPFEEGENQMPYHMSHIPYSPCGGPCMVLQPGVLPPVSPSPYPDRIYANAGGAQRRGRLQGRFHGRIKSFNMKQGFGFIESPEAYQVFGRDVFLHKVQIGDLTVGTKVTYSVEINRNGMPQAREVETLDGQAPAPLANRYRKSSQGRRKGRSRGKGSQSRRQDGQKGGPQGIA